jgi:hypothetical protein
MPRITGLRYSQFRYSPALQDRYRRAVENGAASANSAVVVSTIISLLVGAAAALILAGGQPTNAAIAVGNWLLVLGLLWMQLSDGFLAWIPKADPKGLEKPRRSFKQALRDRGPDPIPWSEVNSGQYALFKIPSTKTDPTPRPRFLLVRLNDGKHLWFDRALYPEALAQIGRELAKRGLVEDIEGPPLPPPRGPPPAGELPVAKLLDHQGGAL